MNKLLLSLLAGASLTCLSNCESYDHDDDDDDDHRRNRGSTTTTTTEETTVSSPTSLVPLSSTVETQTTRTY
jgi:hypothetical protein